MDEYENLLNQYKKTKDINYNTSACEKRIEALIKKFVDILSDDDFTLAVTLKGEILNYRDCIIEEVISFIVDFLQEK